VVRRAGAAQFGAGVQADKTDAIHDGIDVEPDLIEQLVEELLIYHALQTDRERQVLREMVIVEFNDQLRAGIVAHIRTRTQLLLMAAVLMALLAGSGAQRANAAIRAARQDSASPAQATLADLAWLAGGRAWLERIRSSRSVRGRSTA
jgi:hypothetical protein